MAKFEHPGCDCCACPKGLCAGENQDAVTLYVMARGIPAYKVAWALNSLQSGVDFSGCSKLRMAEAWDARGTNPAYQGMASLTNAELKTALEVAKGGERVTPTQRTKKMLWVARRRAA
jgi:hypothetical protein